jgi:hypothetical protein
MTTRPCRQCAAEFMAKGETQFCSDSCRRNYFADVRASSPTAAFCASRGIELKRDGRNLKALCPFHSEKTPSFYVFPDGGCYCFGCGWPGEDRSASVIDLCAQLDGLRPIEAAVKLQTGSTVPLSGIVTVKRLEDRRKKPIWIPRLERPSQADLRRISRSRGEIPIRALVIAVERGFIWCFDDEINGRCWLYTDRRRKCAIRRRVDGEPFQTRSGALTKSAACPNSDMKIPLGYEETAGFPAFSVTEGGPNGLAAIAQAYAAGVEDRVAPIVMPCTGSNFTPESLACLKGKRGRIFPDADPPGRSAAKKWARQLRSAGIVVDGFDFDGLVQINGKPVDDLNNFCKLDPDSDEKHRSATESVMDFAQGGTGHAG